MNELDVVKGLSIGKVYRNPKNCREFAAAIAEVQRNEISKNLAECNFVSVIVDRSMDSSITDNEMIYIQTCKEGSINSNFIHCCQVQCGTAKGVVQAIEQAMNTITDWKTFTSKLVALGSDGASVMLGKTMES